MKYVSVKPAGDNPTPKEIQSAAEYEADLNKFLDEQLNKAGLPPELAIATYPDWSDQVREVTWSDQVREMTRAEGTLDTTKMPYTVEPDDSEKCEHCGRGVRYDVVGPDQVAAPITFKSKDEAQEHADNLSRAYLAGAQAAIKDAATLMSLAPRKLEAKP